MSLSTTAKHKIVVSLEATHDRIAATVTAMVEIFPGIHVS
jgi:hypothetical protein